MGTATTTRTPTYFPFQKLSLEHPLSGTMASTRVNMCVPLCRTVLLRIRSNWILSLCFRELFGIRLLLQAQLLMAGGWEGAGNLPKAWKLYTLTNSIFHLINQRAKLVVVPVKNFEWVSREAHIFDLKPCQCMLGIGDELCFSDKHVSKTMEGKIHLQIWLS